METALEIRFGCVSAAASWRNEYLQIVTGTSLMSNDNANAHVRVQLGGVSFVWGAGRDNA